MKRRIQPQKGKAPQEGFLRGEAGAALVEFALVLPMMLIVFAVILEGARMMWGYQTAITGVREATRYLARITPQNVCSTGASVDGTTDQLTRIVTQTLDGGAILPVDVTVTSLVPSYSCDAGDYRNGPVAIGQVRAQLRIDFPFAALFSFGGGTPASVSTVVTEQSRIYGS